MNLLIIYRNILKAHNVFYNFLHSNWNFLYQVDPSFNMVGCDRHFLEYQGPPQCQTVLAKKELEKTMWNFKPVFANAILVIC